MMTSNVRILVVTCTATTLLCLVIPVVRGAHLKFLLFVWLPFAAWLAVVWGWIVAAPPGAPLHSDVLGGIIYGTKISLRMEAIVGIMQASALSLDVGQLGSGLVSLRLPRHVVLVILSVFALGPELRKRADQVLTSRIARGLMNRRNTWNRIRNASTTLLPLVSWGFRSSALRSEYWMQRRLLDSPQLNEAARFGIYDWFYLVLSIAWCMFAFLGAGIAQKPW